MRSSEGSFYPVT